MNDVHGGISLNVSLSVESSGDDGINEANALLHRDRIIAYELYAIDCKGNRIKVNVNDCIGMDLNEIVEF